MELLQRHVEMRTTRGNEHKPYIAGTRISVADIYICHELKGMRPDEVVQAFPHLTLSQVHSALAYYYEHAEEIRDQIERDEAFADNLKARQGATRFTELQEKMRSAAEMNP